MSCQPPAEPDPARAVPAAGLDSAAIRVRVAQVVSTGLRSAGDVTGVVTAFRKATVAAEVGGRVVHRAVEPGASVAQNDVLVELDRERARLDVQQAEARLASQQVDVAHARHEFKRAQELISRDVISQDVVDDLRFAHEGAVADLSAAESILASSRRALRDTRVVAPFDGTAEIIHVQQGDYLQPGAPVALITDFSRARLHAGVTAADAALLAPGQTATLSFEALGGARLSGSIHSIARIKDVASGTYPVEIWLDDHAATQLREGMVASVQLPYAVEDAQLTIPKSALFRKGGELLVFTVVDNTARSQPVRIGRARGDLVQIVDGLNDGQQVVVDGLFALRDGAPVIVEFATPSS